jgi:hypothetical protein
MSTGGFFSGRAFFTNTTDFDAGTLTYGGPGSPAALTPSSPPPALTLSGSNASFAGLQSEFPDGDYTFDLSGGTMGPTEFVINYAGNAYSNTPELTAASFSALQGLNAGRRFYYAELQRYGRQPECDAGGERDLLFDHEFIRFDRV